MSPCVKCGMPEPHTYTECLDRRGEIFSAKVDEAAELREAIDRLQTRYDDIMDWIRENKPAGNYKTHSGLSVVVSSPPRRFNVGAAAELLPPEVRSTCIKIDWDAKTIKGLLTPEQLDQCFDEGDGKSRVVIK